MKTRSQLVSSVLVLLLLFAGSMLVYRALTDEGEGIKVMSTSVEERVSARFITKSVKQRDNVSVEFGGRGYEDGSANLVTSVVVNYRAFDTLLEVIVLFASAAGVALLAGPRRTSRYREASVIVQTVVPLVNMLVLITGAVIILRGHLSPGGGFAGGAVIASGFILFSLAFRHRVRVRLFIVLESIMGLGIVAVGLLGVYYDGSFLSNFLPPGEIGRLISSGTVFILYLLIGVKVFSEITGISLSFLGGEEEKKA
jgi:multicomponent Na+:H+ antiporter subunit B